MLVRAIWIVVLLVMTGTAPRLLSAQPGGASPAPTRVLVTVVLVDELPREAGAFAIERRPDTSPHDVILLRQDVSQDHLSEALHALLILRQAAGDTITGKAMALRPRPREQSATRRPFPWAGRVLADLRRAEPKPVAGIGTVPAVEIWLPPQRGQGRSR